MQIPFVKWNVVWRQRLQNNSYLVEKWGVFTFYCRLAFDAYHVRRLSFSSAHGATARGIRVSKALLHFIVFLLFSFCTVFLV